ncbi:MAG: glycerol dehydrogenase [Polaromonas sp.]|nr:glycerol dehydrogenase [Polaromonas sp.]
MTTNVPRIIGFPSVYVQGPGAIGRLRTELAQGLGVTSAIVVSDPIVAHLFTAPATLQTPDNGVTLHVLRFGGECTEGEVERLRTDAAPLHAGAVVGAGGGKALDVSKAVAQKLGVPLVIVPTAASSDAPTSRLIALYDEQHKIVAVPTLKRNPDAVIVDTTVIAQAPRRLFIAGIGDALTKRYEVSRARDAGILNYFGGKGTELSLLLAEHAYATLRRDTEEALAALERQAPNAAFERVVEATVLYSGLAFEGGGLSIAHGMLRGLTAYPQALGALHGELVAYGLLVQLQTFGHPEDEIVDLTMFLHHTGLPVRLADIGFEHTEKGFEERVAELTLTAPYVAASRPAVSTADMVDAMRQVEHRARRLFPA